MMELTASVPSRSLEVEIALADGERVALLGPNGAGKSTTLDVIAGFLPASGSLLLDEVAFDGAPAHRRPIGLLAQQPLLFPHLDVLGNVAFPLEHRRGLGRREARRTALTQLADFGVEHLAGRRPAQLSGGQAQRVALARALAAEPRLLLLDEPLAALDVTAVPEMRRALRAAMDGRMGVVVTHDPLDALLLADRAIVLEHGRIVEDRPVVDVLTAPRSDFARALVAQSPWLAVADLDALRSRLA